MRGPLICWKLPFVTLLKSCLRCTRLSSEVGVAEPLRIGKGRDLEFAFVLPKKVLVVDSRMLSIGVDLLADGDPVPTRTLEDKGMFLHIPTWACPDPAKHVVLETCGICKEQVAKLLLTSAEAQPAR